MLDFSDQQTFRSSHTSTTTDRTSCQGHGDVSSAPQFLRRLFRDVMPAAKNELNRWRGQAQRIPDPELREQALLSLTHKRFHADGGCVYAAVYSARSNSLVRLIVAYQTISDYLDNLCDRTGSYDASDFHQLHHAMRDAANPDTPKQNYYQYRDRDDGGYLNALVDACRAELRSLPGYQSIQPQLLWLVERYCELQIYKHIHPDERRRTLETWWSKYADDFPDILWWEFAAATGSTLGVFSLFVAACTDTDGDTSRGITLRYFPWICGLHILLDYLIDLEEDRREGDFNFVACYASPREAHKRIRLFAQRAVEEAKQLQRLPGASIHRYVARGLLAMYLSDAKSLSQKDVRPMRRLVWKSGPLTWLFYAACKLYRWIR